MVQLWGGAAQTNKVSAAYGAKKCGTHTPHATRPGPLSDALREGFTKAGFPLLTDKRELRGVDLRSTHTPPLSNLPLRQSVSRTKLPRSDGTGLWQIPPNSVNAFTANGGRL